MGYLLLRRINMHKMVNGKKVALTDDEIVVFLDRETEHFKKINSYEYRLQKVRERRKAKYPDIGEQLDAILKQLNYMQMSGQTNLVSEMDGVISDWLKVKRDIAKPEKQ